MASIPAPSSVSTATAQEVVPVVSAQMAEPIAAIQEGEISVGAQDAQHFVEVEDAPKMAVGYKYSNGDFVGYGTLTPEQEKKINDLVQYYGGGPGALSNFRINLSTLKDGDGNVLMPRKDLNQTPEQFQADMQALRDIATAVLGLEKMPWKKYDPRGRTLTEFYPGAEQAFEAKHSLRIKDKFTFEHKDLIGWLDKTGEVKPAEDIPEKATADEKKKIEDANDTPAKAAERRRKAIIRHNGALGLMTCITSTIKAQIDVVKEESKDPYSRGAHGRLDKLQKLQGKTPVADVPYTPEAEKKLRETGQMTTRGVILYGAAHFQEVKGLKSADVQEMEKAAAEHLDAYEKQAGECDFRLLPGRSKTRQLTEENQATEKAFCKSLVMLNAADRPDYENLRGALEAEESYDGMEVFYVHLANLLETATSEDKIREYFSGPASKAVFGSLDPIDEGVCRKAALDGVLKLYKATSDVKANQSFDWKSDNAEEVVASYKVAIEKALA